MSFWMNKKDKRKYIGFDDRWFILIGLPIMGLLVPIAFFQLNIFEFSVKIFLIGWLISTLQSGTYWMSFRGFTIIVRRKFFGFKFINKRLIYQFTFIVIFGFLANMIIHLVTGRFIPGGAQSSRFQGLLATYFTSFSVMTVYEAIYLYYQIKENIVETERLKREQIQSELQGLRSQINPHFLFNSLNALMSIVQDDQKLATSFLKKLSHVYRYILENREDHLIHLREELKFIESYIFLHKERFKENFQVDIQISDYYLNKYVVPLSLQILFENAIKHNVISAKKPLFIEVFIDTDQKLVVRNNLQVRNQTMPSTGVGLANIKSRFSFFTEEAVDISQTDDQFIVRLPLLNEYYKMPIDESIDLRR